MGKGCLTLAAPYLDISHTIGNRIGRRSAGSQCPNRRRTRFDADPLKGAPLQLSRRVRSSAAFRSTRDHRSLLEIRHGLLLGLAVDVRSAAPARRRVPADQAQRLENPAAQFPGMPQLGFVRLAHTQRSVTTITVAARTSTQSVALDAVSIVPSISMA